MEWLERRLLKASRPLAVFCYNDYDAADVLNACIRLDIPVPKDVAVLGVDDNSILCETQPFTISSVRYDHESVGYESARLLDRLINSDTAARRSATLSPPILIPPLGITVRTSTDTVAASHPLVSAAMSYIQQNLARQFGAQEIAAHLNVPRIRLDRAFAADIGRSVGSEIRRQRIDRVCKLLANTDISIGQIAAKTGFCNASFMIKSFRQATGITPRAWREMEFARQTRL